MQGLYISIQDWEFTSPKNIIRKVWVCKMFARYARNSISYIYNYWADFSIKFVSMANTVWAYLIPKCRPIVIFALLFFPWLITDAAGMVPDSGYVLRSVLQFGKFIKLPICFTDCIVTCSHSVIWNYNIRIENIWSRIKVLICMALSGISFKRVLWFETPKLIKVLPYHITSFKLSLHFDLESAIRQTWGFWVQHVRFFLWLSTKSWKLNLSLHMLYMVSKSVPSLNKSCVNLIPFLWYLYFTLKPF